MAWHRPITHNFAWKAVSVLLAALIWMTMQSGMQNTLKPVTARTFSRLPIKVMTRAGDPRLFRVEPEHIEATVSGEPEALRRLHAADVEVFVNLAGISEAQALRQKVQVYAPPGVALAGVSPAEVLVSVLAPPAPGAPPKSPP